ncbi:metal ABC transporter permease [Pseudooceanicola sp. LIPI14-2-Ac024]|uniref:metal ABC transporter permease n=1 Tax=Pseudooceanicola sp. LIPI14-2-Ac024 TaxID=3344875 RepID=UPI0035CEF5BB
MLDLGYNASLVALGAGMLGIAGGVVGSFLFLRKRSLVSDAISHATLPGVALAFIVMVAFGGEGRNLFGLMLGSALAAAAGLLSVGWLTRRTRLSEDAAIGAVLSVFFGFGVVLLTVIQTMSAGRQAGLEGYLLGSTAGMLRTDAVIIAVGGLLTLVAVYVLRRVLVLTAFDSEYAASVGIDPNKADLALMGLVLAVTVVGLKIVGLILIVALLILPPVTARFWTDRAGHLALIAGAIGGVAGFLGAVISASAPDLPTGPIIVLVAFAFFAVSMLLAPRRGVLAALVAHLRFRDRVHRRQGLLALAQGQAIHEALTLRILRRAGLIRGDGVATEAGRAQAAKALLDERRWQILRAGDRTGSLSARYDGLTPIETVLTPDQVAEIDRHLRPEALA